SIRRRPRRATRRSRPPAPLAPAAGAATHATSRPTPPCSCVGPDPRRRARASPAGGRGRDGGLEGPGGEAAGGAGVSGPAQSPAELTEGRNGNRQELRQFPEVRNIFRD